MLAWINYLRIVADTPDKQLFYITGLVLLASGMMGYFFIRKKTWYDLTGGIIPNMNFNFGIFNPFIPMVAFSWPLFGIASSL